MTMFWRENAAQQQQQQQQQHTQQQPAHDLQQPKRLSFSFNVKIAVNVNTKMFTTHINGGEPARSSSSSSSRASSRGSFRSRRGSRSASSSSCGAARIQRQSTQLVGLREQLVHLGRRLGRAKITSGHGNISTILILNLLMLLLLSLCCDVCCRSHAEQAPLNFTDAGVGVGAGVGSVSGASALSHMRPTLDSDVVEKVAVWNKHVGAAPPTLAEGIAISSVARAAAPVPAATHDRRQREEQDVETEAVGVDERILLERVTRDCVQRCIVEEDLFLDEFGIKCEKADNSDKCYKTRCTKGCAQWYRALKEIEPCQDACVSSQFYPYDMPCISACEMAQRDYWHLQRLAMTQLVETTQPQLLELVDESATLTIKWDMQFPENYLSSRPFNIQYKHVDEEEDQEEEAAQSWQNLADYDCDEYYVCEILETLVPYSRYKFRFELPFGESSADVLYSPATPVYQTPMAGAPISEPIITSLLALDESHVAVHWRPGRYSNAPIEGFRVKLGESREQVSEGICLQATKPSNAACSLLSALLQLLPATRDSCIFGQLQPLTNHTLRLTTINKQGESPPAVASVLTKEPQEPEQLQAVLLVGRRGILWQSLEPAGELRVVVNASVRDFGWCEREQRLWYLNARGELRSLLLEAQEEQQRANPGQLLPGNYTRLTVDWLRRRLYLVAHNGSLLSANFEGSDVQSLLTQPLEPLEPLVVQQLEADPLNGWLFWRDTECIWRLDLHSGQQLRLNQPLGQPLGAFVLAPQRWLLYVLLPQEQQLLELSYDGSLKLPLQLGVAANGSWRSFAMSQDQSQLLLANGSQLQLLERHTLLPIASWTLLQQQQEQQEQQEDHEDHDCCWRLLPLGRRRQPLALEPALPRQLRALLGAQAARIAWQAPALNPFQSAASSLARNCSYELEVLDVASQSAYNIRNIRSPHFGLERLQPNNLYQLRVRAINAAGQPGVWTPALSSRTWPLGEHRLRWATRSGRLYTTNELGAQLEELPAQLAEQPGALAMLNASIGYYVAGGSGTLHCINVLQPQLGCSPPLPHAAVQHVGDVAYDWRGGLLYWTDLARDCVQRLDPLSGQRELLPVFGARQLALDSAQGHLYYASSSHLARRALNAQTTQQPELEYYHVNGLAGGISAFCLDLEQRHIYWLVQAHPGLHLYRTELSAAPLQLLLTLPQADAVPQTLQLLQPLGALLWLDGGARSAQLLRLGEGGTASGADAGAGAGAGAQVEQLQQLLPLGLDALPLSAVQLLGDTLPAPDEGVRPLAIPPDTVRIDEGGHWDDFRLRWQPAASGGNHSVCYRLLLEQGKERLLTLELVTPFARITQLAQQTAPGMGMRVSLTPHTAWRAGPTTRLQLATPMAAPSQPRRLRVFVERRAEPLQLAPNVSALLRWDVPDAAEEVSGGGSAGSAAGGSSLQYQISCWRGTELHAELLLDRNTLEARIEQLQPAETYRFQVQAQHHPHQLHHQPPPAASLALHVAPEVQSVPRVLYANAEHIGELDLDTAAHRQLVHTSSPVEHLTLLLGEQRLLWVNEHVELLSHVPGQAGPAKLARMRAEVLALTVDWVQRVVYWAELDASTTPPAAAIYRLELCRFEGRIMQGERVWSTPPGQLLRDLLALPHAQALVWLQHELGARNATLQARHLGNGSAWSDWQGLPEEPLWRLYEGSQEPQAETLNLIDQLGRLCIYHVARQLCMPSTLRAQLNLLNDDVAQLVQDAGYVYALRNSSVRAYGRRRQQLEYLLELQPDEVRLLRAYNYQAYPPRHCLLLPALAPDVWQPESEPEPRCEETQCSLWLPALTAGEDCALPVPGLSYQLNVSVGAAQDQEQEQEQQPLQQLHAVGGTWLNVTGLQPFRQYELRVRISSYYQQRLEQAPLLLPAPLQLQTAVATPTAPRNFSGRTLSPSELEVSWLPPQQLRSASVYYTLHWQQQQEEEKEQQQEQLPAQQQRVEQAGVQRLTGLHPGRRYVVWLHAHATPSKYNSSGRLTLRCFAPLPPLQLLQLDAYAMTLGWAGTPDALSSLQLECRSRREQLQLQLDLAGNHSLIHVTQLQPKTIYSCRLALNYVDSGAVAPTYYGASQEYETRGDAPSAPGKPQLEHIAGEIFRVSWTPALEHGAPIVLYNLEALQAHRTRGQGWPRRRRRRETSLALLPWAEEPLVLEDQWLDLCNTTELSCIVRELHSQRLLLFRVRARNRAHGWGPYSEDSERIAEPFVSPEKRGSLVLAIIAPAAIVSSCVLALVLVRKVQKRRHRAKKLLQQSRPSIWSNLSTLQTQQQLLAARSRTFSMTLSDADIALLPQISWNRLTLLRFLGSGAFGEVYEGQLQGEDEAQPQRVAIKSLRKGASEFAELLQEAQLMSNFKHENIVALIGICFDSESISLIMEHMEAGDLLSYLRAARPSTKDAEAKLQLPSLLSMCLDVASGCSYLEDMHFVHRDLACRNCLVSDGAAIGGRRIVKIGDFGLARDIYKSDYYRKEGEGLLPVRWMAPESLVDGLFSTQSDVWAFGVLCWEILTLGQQPYAARNNFEVLAHVKEGGRLQPPDECPERLYVLMLQCWRSEPWERPSFRRCLGMLQSISAELRRSDLPEIEGSSCSPSSSACSSSSAGSGSGSCSAASKPDQRVRFDEQLEEQQDTKEMPANNN
ncbi:hypothetical protein KR222_002087, partial [Zaprionus bogoriensis]